MIESYRKQVTVTNNEKDKLLKLKKDSSQIYLDIAESEKKKSLEHESIENLQKYKIEQESHLLKLSSNINLIKSFSIDSVISVKFKSDEDVSKNDGIAKLNNLQNQFKEDKNQLLIIDREKEKLSKQLESTKSQSKAILTLINKATEIISDSEMSACPVCQQQYADVQSLQKQITSNPILSKLEKDLTTKNQSLKISLNEHENKLNKLKDSYNSLRDTLLSSEVAIEETALKAVSDSKNKIENARKQIAFFEDLINKSKSAVLHKSSLELKQYILSNENELNKKNCGIESSISEIEGNLKNTRTDIQLTKDELVKLKSSKKIHEFSSDGWNEFTDYLIKNNISISEEQTVISSFISNKLSSLKEDLSKFSSQKDEIEKEIKQVKAQIPSHYADLAIEKRNKFENVLHETNLSLKEFYAVLVILKADVPNTEQEWTSLLRNAKKALVSISLQDRSDIKTSNKIQLLNDLGLQALNFCNRQMHLEIINNKKDELSNHLRILEPLENDLANINLYIESTANEYFKTNLINQIYSSIDPHPEYKNICFECKVPNNDKAELNISLVNPDNGDKVSPNLHFSSAQINVLSLSIFLARALTATDDNEEPVTWSTKFSHPS